MPRYLVKVTPDEDLYVEWSTIVDAPTAWGTREEMFEYLLRWDQKKEEYARPEIEERFARADEYGTSSLHRDYDWDDDEFMYLQSGLVPRARLAEFLHSFNPEDQSFDESLLFPFEDD
jgi:hypothetical protein